MARQAIQDSKWVVAARGVGTPKKKKAPVPKNGAFRWLNSRRTTYLEGP